MTEPDQPALDDLLSNFALGPAWARGQDEKKSGHNPKHGKSSDRGGRRDDRRGESRGDHRGDHRGGRDFKGKRPIQKGRGNKFEERRNETPPAAGVRVTLTPSQHAVHLIAKEVQQVARVYPLFDIAKTLLAERNRCHATFEVEESRPPLIKGKLDDSLFLKREEANHHLWHSELRSRYLDEETSEVDPPAGNFQAVAKCGLSGEWLGPPNFHTYQTSLRRIHRERFAHMSFEAYSAKVRTERGEEAVNAWLETMRLRTRWKLKGEEGDAAWTSDRSRAEHLLSAHAFDEAFEETRRCELPAAVPESHLSPQLRVSLQLAGNHARKHPAMMIPSICKSVEAEHLPVFKRKGKLYTGPVRPHPLPADATLAPRPAQMVEWIRANPPAKLEGLWKSVLPEGSTAPPADYAADLFWLLQQGHILLFTDDTLIVQEVRPPQPAKKEAKKKAKKQAAEKPADDTTASPEASPETPVAAEPSASPAAEAETRDEPSLADEPAAAEPVEQPRESAAEPETAASESPEELPAAEPAAEAEAPSVEASAPPEKEPEGPAAP